MCGIIKFLFSEMQVRYEIQVNHKQNCKLKTDISKESWKTAIGLGICVKKLVGTIGKSILK